MLEKPKQSPLLRAACAAYGGGAPYPYTGGMNEVAHWPPRELTTDERADLMLNGLRLKLDLDTSRYRDAYLEAAPQLREANYRQRIAQLDAIQERHRVYLMKHGWWQ